MTKKNVNIRIVWIDWAKSICMFLVIMGHCHMDNSGQVVSQFIYSFHMMLFFFLSGLLCKRSVSIESLIKDSRFILVPYFVFGILGLIIGVILSRSFILSDVLFHFYKLLIGKDASIGAIWFLPALFICKQLFLVLMIIKNKRIIIYYVFVVLSFFSAFFFSHYKYNLPFFADSALCGFPFFIVGNESYDSIGYLFKQRKSVRLWCAFILFALSVLMSNINGFVCLADCQIGKSIVLFYLTAFCAILSLILTCSFLNTVISTFVTITAYGTIVTLGLHGFFLSFFNYYLPILLGFVPGLYSIYWAFLFSTLTYFGCFFLILVVNKYCPKMFGLRGNVPGNNRN